MMIRFVFFFGDFNSRIANKSDFNEFDECLINSVDKDNEIYNQLLSVNSLSKLGIQINRNSIDTKCN